MQTSVAEYSCLLAIYVAQGLKPFSLRAGA